MRTQRTAIIAPVLIIGVGIGWLLNVLDFLHTVEWVWPVSLAVGAILAVVFGGANKLTFVLCPFLLVSSMFSVLRQVGRLRVNLEVPCLVILIGVLWLVAEILKLPTPEWLKREDEQQRVK
jgi:hypothetical protein